MVKVLLLAAGYGTRLQRDIEADGGRLYGHLRGLPKPLVPVGHKPVASHWADMVAEAGLEPSRDLYIVTNARYHAMFVRWAANSGFPASHILNDRSRDNEGRLGAVADVRLAVERLGLDADEEGVLVAGGDTLFKEDFSLREVLGEWRARPRGSSLVLWYDVAETEKHGILEVDEGTGRVAAFLEKPSRDATASRKACPCFYLYAPAALARLGEYLDEVEGGDRRLRDAPGHFLAWVHSREPVYALRISGRYDIGGLRSYIEANRALRRDSSSGSVAARDGDDGADDADADAPICGGVCGGSGGGGGGDDGDKDGDDDAWPEDTVSRVVAGAAVVGALAFGLARLLK